jgi:DNA topoisomerase VI subunit B
MSRLCISRLKIFAAECKICSSERVSYSIVIQPQQGQGKSNIVFSSSISIGDAIKAASKLKSDLKIARIDLDISDTKDSSFVVRSF